MNPASFLSGTAATPQEQEDFGILLFAAQPPTKSMKIADVGNNNNRFYRLAEGRNKLSMLNLLGSGLLKIRKKCFEIM